LSGMAGSSCPRAASPQTAFAAPGWLIGIARYCAGPLTSPRRPRGREHGRNRGWAARWPPDHAGARSVRDSCQTCRVSENEPARALAQRLAHELGECRQRGLERLDVDTHNQHPVGLIELQRLASEYAQATQSALRGRIPQIKKLLRDCLNGIERDDPDDARLIRDLLFGDDEHTISASAGELLDRAKQKYRYFNEARFRAQRNAAFLTLAGYIPDFVARAQLQAAAEAGDSHGRHDDQDRPGAGPSEGRFWRSSSLEAILRFSLEDPGRSSNLTIKEHQDIIARHGSCWWGWFRAAHDVDHSITISQRLVNCEIGLWERPSGLFYIARCELAATNNRAPIPPPDPELTPEYYRSSRWPAWLKLSLIRECTGQEIAERFGDLPNTRATIYWGPEPLQGPVTVSARGDSILHLSDLHFGEFHRWNTSRTQWRSSMTTEQAIIRTLRLRSVDLASIGIVVICGNLCSGEPARESYDEALAFIDGLCEQLPNVGRGSFVIVPGADDFARPGDRERAVQMLYREFYQDLYGSSELDISRLRQYVLNDFLLNVLPANSVKMLGTDQRDEGVFGHGYDSSLDSMLRDFEGPRERSLVVNVVAAHHHLVPATPSLPTNVPQESVRSRLMPGIHDARDVFGALSANRVSLFLHGHLHEAEVFILTSDDGWQTAVCGPGTAGAAGWWLRSKYRDNHSNSVALYSIRNQRIQGRMFIFDEDQRRAAMVRHFDIAAGPRQPSQA
jgi:hypothetical protein